MRQNRKLLGMFIALGLSVWVLDSLLDYFLFYSNDFWGLLLFHVPAHELYMRSAILLLLILFGLIVSKFSAGYGPSRLELQKSEEKFRMISEHALVGVMIIQNERCQYVNQAVADICECSIEELMSLKSNDWIRIFPPEHQECVLKLFEHQEKSEGDITADHSICIMTKSGRAKWINIFSKTIPYEGKMANFITMADVTGLKRAEKTHADEKERLMVTLRSIGDAVVATDISGNILIFNKVAEELTGWKESEVAGHPLDEILNIVDEYTLERYLGLVDKILKDGALASLADGALLISREGKEIAISDSGAPIYDKDGNIIGVVLVFRDITETRGLQEFAAKAQRLETAGRIAGQVAHDFNNLLGPLTAYPSLIKSELPPDHPAIELIDQIENSARQMAEINQQLLTLSRRGHYTHEPLSLNDIVTQVVKNYYPLADHVIIETNLSQNLLNIRGGSSQIYRVISNLITNAFDAIPGNGKLSIKTENFYVDEVWRKHGRVPRGEYVRLTVSDTGTGIPAEILPKIFDPFFTTKTAAGTRGSGLGLSVVHTVVEDHNGYVDCCSEVGKGTNFYLYFPIARESVESSVSEKVSGGNESILVVDDDPTQRDVCKTLLEKLGYNVKAVESGEDAAELLQRESYDLLVLDMVMHGGVDGTETYRKAVEIRPDQKAIIVSGYAESKRVNEAIQLGATLFLRKPLTIKSIATAVRKSLDSVPARES